MVMLGGLHTEMALWHTLGDILEGSGWTTALTEAGGAHSGKADSFLRAAHLTRTRHAHQVTLLNLRNLQKEAFMLSELPRDFEFATAWRNDMQIIKSYLYVFGSCHEISNPHSHLRQSSHREKKIPLYVDVLEELTPLLFALDRVIYAQWLPVHIRDIKSLPDSIKDEFEN